MKKLISLSLCFALIVSAVSLSSFSFAARAEIVEQRIVYDDDGFSYKIYNSDGTEVIKAKPSLTPASKAGKAPRRTASSLPSSYSAADAGVLPNVKNQGETGTCWAFAALTALEADAVSQGLMEQNEMKFSPSHLAWFTYTLPEDENGVTGEGVSSPAPYMRGGNYMLASSTLLEWSGISRLSDYPFYPYSIPSMSYFTEQQRYDTGSGFIIDSVKVFYNADEIKSWIMEHGVCTAGIYYNEDYENKTTSSYYCPDKPGMNHNISIVGWDDSYPASSFKTNPGGPGAWLVMDSWGASNHNRGFYYLSYYNAETDYTVGYTLREKGSEFNHYNYNGAPYTSFIGTGQPELKAANVFTASYSESVSAVSFYTTNPGRSVTVKIYTNIPSGGGPVSGTLACTKAYSATHEGLHTVQLDSPVPVNPGTRFSVVAELTADDGEAVTMPVEIDPDGSGMYNYISHSGESYIDLGQWADITDYGYGNFYIQAYTRCRHPYEQITVAPTCTESGTVSDVCPQCGEVYSVVEVPATGHSFSEWSDYESAGSHLESTRVCTACGVTQTRELLLGGKTITLDRLLRIIFDRIFDAVYAAFGKERKNR